MSTEVSFLPNLVWMRVPRLSLTHVETLLNCKDEKELDQHLSDYLKLPEVQRALLTAHPALFKSVFLNDKSEPGKFRSVLAKYLLRAAYRCTPYGAMAGIASLTIGDKPSSCWETTGNWEERHYLNAETEQSINNEKFFRSPSEINYITNLCSSVLSNIYTVYDFEEIQGKRLYQKKSVQVDSKVKRFLEFTKEEKSFEEIRKFFKVAPSEASGLVKFLKELIDARLLSPVLFKSSIQDSPDIEPDFFTRDGQRRGLALNTDLKLDIEDTTISLEEITPILDFLENFLQMKINKSFSEDVWFSHVKETFIKNYPEQRVPLLQFLSTVHHDIDPFAPIPEVQYREEWLEFLSSAQALQKDVLDIPEDLMRKFKRIPLINTPAEMNGVSVCASLSAKPDDDIKAALHYTVKGYKGLRMFSRHFHLFPELKLPENKATANSYIYADIECLSSIQVRNLSLRPSWVGHTIRLDPMTDHEGKNIIEVRDLYLEYGPVGFRIFHPGLKKFIIPVATSAYNMTRDNHPVYRFLSILSLNSYGHEEGVAFFPAGRHFNPRLTYKGIMIQPKTWFFPREYFMDNFHKQDFRISHRLPERVCLCNRDQKIPLKLDAAYISRQILASDKNPFIRIEEDWKTSAGRKIVLNGERHHHEILFDYFNKTPRNPRGAPTFPHKEWAYPHENIVQLNFFLPVKFMDSFLVKFLRKEILTHEKGKNISGWYFIKYPEPTPHVRLRLFGKNINPWNMISRNLEQYRKEFLIGSVSQTPFEKETVLYGDDKGLELYMLLSRKLSRFYLSHQEKKKNLRLNAYLKLGTDFDLSALVLFINKLKNAFPEAAQPGLVLNEDAIGAYKKELSHCWKQIRMTYLNERTKEGKTLNKMVGVLVDDLLVTMKKWRAKNKYSKLKEEFLVMRIVHMEVFRYSCGQYPNMEIAAYELNEKLERQISYQQQEQQT